MDESYYSREVRNVREVFRLGISCWGRLVDESYYSREVRNVREVFGLGISCWGRLKNESYYSREVRDVREVFYILFTTLSIPSFREGTPKLMTKPKRN